MSRRRDISPTESEGQARKERRKEARKGYSHRARTHKRRKLSPLPSVRRAHRAFSNRYPILISGRRDSDANEVLLSPLQVQSALRLSRRGGLQVVHRL